MVVVGSIPTALIGLIFKDPLEKMFGAVTTVGVMLLITGVIVGVTKFISLDHGKWEQVKLWMALIIGTAQGLAIIPGISRSGSTIVCALLLGLRRETAGGFLFLLSIPAIIGAVGLHLESDAIARVGVIPLMVGFSFFGTGGIFLLLNCSWALVKKGHFYYFAPYCWIVGALVIILL
jgi:Uncharacterized bacitracin resistance protein